MLSIGYWMTDLAICRINLIYKPVVGLQKTKRSIVAYGSEDVDSVFQVKIKNNYINDDDFNSIVQ